MGCCRGTAAGLRGFRKATRLRLRSSLARGQAAVFPSLSFFLFFFPRQDS